MFWSGSESQGREREPELLHFRLGPFGNSGSAGPDLAYRVAVAELPASDKRQRRHCATRRRIRHAKRHQRSALSVLFPCTSVPRSPRWTRQARVTCGARCATAGHLPGACCGTDRSAPAPSSSSGAGWHGWIKWIPGSRLSPVDERAAAHHAPLTQRASRASRECVNDSPRGTDNNNAKMQRGKSKIRRGLARLAESLG